MRSLARQTQRDEGVRPAAAEKGAAPRDADAGHVRRDGPLRVRTHRAVPARAARYLGEGLLETLWPTRCVGCDRPGALLCDACAAALPAIDQAEACPRCGAPFGRLTCTECTRCRERDDEGACAARPGEPDPRDLPAPPFDRLDGLVCFGVHDWPLDRLVRAYKDGGERRCAELLAGLLVRAVRAAGEAGSVDPGALDAVTFVPCTPRAYARRGFDHMEAVARAVADGLGLPLTDVLARRDSRDQRGLGRDLRAENARGTTVALGRLDGARLLLLDDVVTTGATMGAAADVLKKAGAARVTGAAVARAW